MTKEALKLALKALETNNKAWKHLADSCDAGFWEAEEQGFYELSVKAITAIKQVLANEALEKKAENARELGLNYEPVAYVKTVIEALYENSDPVSVEAAELLERITTSPPVAEPHKRKPLSDEQIYDMYNEPRSDAEMIAFARAIEAEHGIKG